MSSARGRVDGSVSDTHKKGQRLLGKPYTAEFSSSSDGTSAVGSRRSANETRPPSSQFRPSPDS